jgi:fucose permease
MKLQYKHTRYACYLGYITQAIVSNLTPLLVVIFQKQFAISLDQITLLLTLGFGVQILSDILSTRFVDKIGYRTALVGSHLLSIMGLLAIGILPFVMNPFAGLLIGVMFNALGGGLIEVMISPVIESLPSDAKASDMSMLHSFYAWGYVGVVLISTLFLNVIGSEHWYYIPVFWALVPLMNVFLFAKTPLNTLDSGEEKIPVRKLFSAKIFWVLFILMICSGASEQAMSKWVSLFAELGLGVSKTMGDLLGPCAFALLMGVTRVAYSKLGNKLDLKKALIASCILCIFSYLLVALSPIPLLSLLGSALCGLSIGLLWPATLSLSSQAYPAGGTSMFGLLALGGDIGCAVGPSMVGLVSNAVISSEASFFRQIFTGTDITQIGLKAGLFMAIIFPTLMLINVKRLRK